MITKEVLEKVKNSTLLYHAYIIGDRYYMIKFDLSSEITKTQRLREKGVNYAGPISQLKLDESKFVIEEYLAKGKNMESFTMGFSFEDNDYQKIELDFEKFFQPYLEELKNRASAKLEIYDKLFRDIIEMNKENLTVDCCSTGNIFFDLKDGFSIIDAYPGNNIPNLDSLIHLILGDLPTITCKNNNQYIDNAVPQKYVTEYISYINLIKEKFINVAIKYVKDYNVNLNNYIPTSINANELESLSNLERFNGIVISI